MFARRKDDQSFDGTFSMTLDKSLLHYFVRDALGPYSEDFRVHDRQNPTTFRLNGREYSAHVSYVHDSGEGRTNPDEVRIQIGRPLIERQRDHFDNGKRVSFIGFFEEGKTFIAWDPRHIFSLQAEKVVSVYGRHSQLEKVDESQAAVHSFNASLLKEKSFAIALPSSALGFYLENITHFHRLPSEGAIQHLMQGHTNTFTESGLGSYGEFDIETDEEREKFTYERKAYPRDPRFKKWVLTAYSKTCCVCDRQLGIVQAAHIIPHSEEDCPNSVQNGLAMCIEHHRLYDDGLLLPAPDRTLIFNDERAAYLHQTGQGRGLDGIRELSKRGYSIPAEDQFKPLDEYLERGVNLRLAG